MSIAISLAHVMVITSTTSSLTSLVISCEILPLLRFLLVIFTSSISSTESPATSSSPFAQKAEGIARKRQPGKTKTGFQHQKGWMRGNGWGRGQVHPFVLSSSELLPSLTSSARLVDFCVRTSNPDLFDKTRSINKPRSNICVYELAINRWTSFYRSLPLLGIDFSPLGSCKGGLVCELGPVSIPKAHGEGCEASLSMLLPLPVCWRR
ncbi:hypothetical protein H5410_061242 [Solanum commersonii]|uniref:Uncharacterized protein n=1 Tax=Solanum commersonii TaxID=4109 RepID=A0A9J5W8B9_SOLCO|nr:hypothetical protein H5410_061242 [Solanum commersonii]